MKIIIIKNYLHSNQKKFFNGPAKPALAAVPAIYKQPDIELAVFVSGDVRMCHGSIYFVIPVPEQRNHVKCVPVNDLDSGNLAGPAWHVLRESRVLVVNYGPIVKTAPQWHQFYVHTHYKPIVVFRIRARSAFCVIEAIIELFYHG